MASKDSAERLQELQRRIEQWRLTRRKLGPMPAALWDEATALARILGACPVSRALGVGYHSLQQRVAEPARRVPAGSGVNSASFIELSGAELVGGAPMTGASAIVEVVTNDGARLTVRLPPSALLDVAAVVESFRRRG